MWTFFTVLAWVVGGSTLIHFWLSRVHRSERENLAGTGTLFEQAAVLTVVKTSSLLAWSIRWVTVDVLITTRGAVLFQRNLFTAQPPIRLVRSQDEANAITRWLVVPVIITSAPRIESGGLVIDAATSWS